MVAGEVGSFTYNVTMTLGAGALARSARGWLRNYYESLRERLPDSQNARRWAVTGPAWWQRGMLFHPFIVDPLSQQPRVWPAKSAKSSSL